MTLDGPLLWFLNRGTGIVLIVLLTASTCLGVLALRGRAGAMLPAFVRQDVHRNISLLSTVLLFGHVVTAVVDQYVDIRWWQAFSPFGSTYKPLWLGLGAVSLDLILLVVVTSLFRARMSARLWRNLHWFAYLAWAMGVAHSAGIGTDATTSWGRWLGLGCVGLVLLAATVRLAPAPRRTTQVVR
ncbi:MAG: ferric reductase-like transmembrane domain-containing protein [Marmoricola sp.]